MKLGAQLFTVRDFTQNLDDFAETLKKVAQIGYKSVQVSATCAYEPHWLDSQLKKNGLVCAVTHTNAERLRNETDKVVAEHKVFGCSYIGIGVAPNLNTFSEDFIGTAKRMKEQGAKFMFHNHSYEFVHVEGSKKVILEKMAEDFAKDELSFILDTYWIQAAGADPAQWIKKLAGRVECVHLKDMIYAGNRQTKMAPIYEGLMNFDSIIDACAASGTEYLLVEQDDCYGEDPFECLAKSYNNLKAKGLS